MRLRNLTLYRGFISLCAAAACGLSCSSAAVNLSDCALLVTDSDNNREISFKANKTFCVKLQAQTSTGYSWEVAKTGDTLKIIGAPQVISPPKHKRMMGGIEYQLFRVSAVRAGAGDLELQYRRPWMKTEAPAKVFRVKATVTD
jgi:predicted secreted protein